MKEDFACSVLRIIAVVIATVGCALVLVTIFYMWGLSSLVGSGLGSAQVQVSIGQVGWYYVMAHAAIVGLGVLLFLLSPALARRVVE